uniref:Uncharacterized protein n=1 Tax=Cucumis melo TaxID=3656 RepID=A0A9I9E1E2_CUCME
TERTRRRRKTGQERTRSSVIRSVDEEELQKELGLRGKKFFDRISFSLWQPLHQ